jgi:hypothetical protein
MSFVRPFKSELVIEERIKESELRAYHIGFDNGHFRMTPLVDIIRSVIPEFALGYYCGATIPLTEMVERLKEAAQTVYTTDKYKKRGEFGELILHLLLRDFHGTLPLISKIYFKDAHNVTIHGFDGVQISIHGEEKKLWLGESKLYTLGMMGVKELANDIKNHVTAEYLQKEFTLISRKLPNNVPEIAHWRALMDKHQKLSVIFSSIVIPMVCTYSSEIFDQHNAETQQYFRAFEEECRKLEAEFKKFKPATTVQIILMLLPVPCKDKLNDELDKRLKSMQNI